MHGSAFAMEDSKINIGAGKHRRHSRAHGQFVARVCSCALQEFTPALWSVSRQCSINRTHAACVANAGFHLRYGGVYAEAMWLPHRPVHLTPLGGRAGACQDKRVRAL
jgi:hypothetical protein